MRINVTSNLPQMADALQRGASQVPFAISKALNATAKKAMAAVKAEMPRVFDRPTPWVINSLRIKYATKQKLSAELAYKDRNSAESSRSMVEPHVFGGTRKYKAMEARLLKIGLLPRGYSAVPGQGATLDAFGNMSRGQVSQLLNVLGAYQEAGYNKANDKTRARLAKGNAKKNIYGFVYWVNPVDGNRKAKHIQPGVYQRVTTGFGTSLKPILMFVKEAEYKKSLRFFEVVEEVTAREFSGEFTIAFEEAMRTALLREQGTLL